MATATSGWAAAQAAAWVADAVDEDAPEQEQGDDGDRLRAQAAGPVEGVVEVGPGHGHEGGVDRAQAPPVLQQAGELHEVGAGVGVGGAPSDEDDRGALGGGQALEGGAGPVLGHVEDGGVDAEVAGQAEADVGVAAAGPGQDGGTVVLEVAGAEEDVGDGGHVGGARRRRGGRRRRRRGARPARGSRRRPGRPGAAAARTRAVSWANSSAAAGSRLPWPTRRRSVTGHAATPEDEGGGRRAARAAAASGSGGGGAGRRGRPARSARRPAGAAPGGEGDLQPVGPLDAADEEHAEGPGHGRPLAPPAPGAGPDRARQAEAGQLVAQHLELAGGEGDQVAEPRRQAQAAEAGDRLRRGRGRGHRRHGHDADGGLGQEGQADLQPGLATG